MFDPLESRAAAVSAFMALSLSCAVPLAAQDRLTFVGVALDQETRQADRKLVEHLQRQTNTSLSNEEFEYERVVDSLVNWRQEDGPFVAHVTPYVYVVAEMLGADFEVLATYVSNATGARTYHSYLVVNRKAYTRAPTPAEIARTLQGQQTRARFIFHNRFSASSFFLPSHFLRANRIFDMPESTETLTAIRGERIAENSSSRLVEMVASGQADLAAVWDATKNKFEKPGQAAGAQVYFSQLPQLIPNDLLVCSTSLSATTKEALRAAIRGLGPGGIGIGDFKTWQDIRDASDARAALADLRWLARERAAPVTIDIRLRSGANRPQHALMIEAARQAVRLAGTELVLYDPDFHEHIDFVWTIEPVHDGAVVLRSAIPGASVDDQIFRLSFRDSEDLAKRVVGLIHTRLHRIRYIWPYSTSQPILIRDLPFALPAGTSVKAQRISWLDPERNKFRAGPLFNARISHSGYYRYAFDTDDFARAGEAITNLDPLGNTSYRVFLLRPGDERLVFVILTGVVIALLLIAAGAFIHDWIKTRAAQETTEEVETLPTLEV